MAPVKEKVYGRGLKWAECNRSLRKGKKNGPTDFKIFNFGEFLLEELKPVNNRSKVIKEYPTTFKLRMLKNELKTKKRILIPYCYYDEANPANDHAVALLYDRITKIISVYDVIEDTRRMSLVNKDIRRTFEKMGLPVKKMKMMRTGRQWPVSSGCALMPLCLSEQLNAGKQIHYPTDAEVWEMYDLCHSDNTKTLEWVAHTS